MSTTITPTTLEPTTVYPTTLEPTTSGPTTAPPHFPRNPDLDFTIFCKPLEIELSIEGSQFNVCIDRGPIEMVLDFKTTHPVLGVVVNCKPIEIVIVPSFTYLTIESMKKNWVKWSKIGYLDFTIDHSNVAGERPVDWKGWVYAIKKLGNKIVVYGENGVTVLELKDVNVGMTTIYRVGVANSGAVAGDDGIHFFVDKSYKLFKLEAKLTLLDYSEFISQLSSPIILSYDKLKELLYICDGTQGFVYGVRTESFGEGPPNITGIDSQSGTIYVAAPGPVVTPKFEICTDIYDFGTRKPKTIEVVEIGSNLTEDLYASVEYRTSYKDDFKQIDWFLVNPNGKSYPKCYGVEFRFPFKSFISEYFEIDYIKIKGFIHGYSPLDTTSAISNLMAASKQK